MKHGTSTMNFIMNFNNHYITRFIILYKTFDYTYTYTYITYTYYLLILILLILKHFMVISAEGSCPLADTSRGRNIIRKYACPKSGLLRLKK